ncbi:MAG: Mu-like prophage major head subunit gpT family protein, partial [Synergistaceae bacterium]|nr:Mu-like prophage major head subunit gpT family protein [Synergistaceae bacterium]
KMADLMETKDTYSIGTFGKKFALTRQAIINDDLGAFTRIPQMFGRSAARTINRTVYRLLKSNPKIAEDGKEVFHMAHNNLGDAATLSIEALDKARIAMRRQTGLRKDKEKVPLNITPTTLLIPPELETTARQLLYSDTDIRYANAAVKNPFLNAFNIIVESELEDYEWYLLASSTVIDTMEVAFLNGQQSPTLEQQQGWNVDGIEYKIRLDFGAWLYEYRGMYKNPGAAPAAVGA